MGCRSAGFAVFRRSLSHTKGTTMPGGWNYGHQCVTPLAFVILYEDSDLPLRHFLKRAFRCCCWCQSRPFICRCRSAVLKSSDVTEISPRGSGCCCPMVTTALIILSFGRGVNWFVGRHRFATRGLRQLRARSFGSQPIWKKTEAIWIQFAESFPRSNCREVTWSSAQTNGKRDSITSHSDCNQRTFAGPAALTEKHHR